MEGLAYGHRLLVVAKDFHDIVARFPGVLVKILTGPELDLARDALKDWHRFSTNHILCSIRNVVCTSS